MMTLLIGNQVRVAPKGGTHILKLKVTLQQGTVQSMEQVQHRVSGVSIPALAEARILMQP